MPTTRIRVPSPVSPGDEVEIKTLIMHPMETGFRQDSMGKHIPRRILHRFECLFEGESVVDFELQPGIAANPLISFVMIATQSGQLTFRWHDDDGSVHQEVAGIRVEEPPGQRPSTGDSR